MKSAESWRRKILAQPKVLKAEESRIYPQGVCRIRKPACAGNGCAIFPAFWYRRVGGKDLLTVADDLYANEIAVYLLAKKMLSNCREIEVPCVKVKMGQRILTAKKEEKVSVGRAYYHCAPDRYPPLLIAELGGAYTGIFLPFDNYFTAEDYTLLEREARENGWCCLSIKLPRISNERSLNIKLTQNTLQAASLAPQCCAERNRRKRLLARSSAS